MNVPISKQGSMLPRQAVTWHGDDRVIQSQGSRVCISSWSPLGQGAWEKLQRMRALWIRGYGGGQREVWDQNQGMRQGLLPPFFVLI